MTASSTVPAAAAADERRLLPKVLKYAGGSVVATVCSEAVFLLMYGALHTSTTPAAVLSWLAGALPNYWMNRRWAWERTGRPSMRHEVAPYVVVVLVTLVLATVLTGAADAALTHLGVAGSVRVVLVALAFLGVYGVMFVLRFLVFDRLFTRLDRIEAASAQEAVLD